MPIDKEYKPDELIFNAEQTKKILHYFYPTEKQKLAMINCSSYSAQNLAMLYLLLIGLKIFTVQA